MKTLLFLIFASASLLSCAQPSCTPCEKLKVLKLPDVTITSVEALKSDTVKGSEGWMPTVYINKPFCRVLGTISKEINFELLLPEEWNGRFLMSGGGGFVGSIQNDLKGTVNNGYATAGTDTGHKGGADAAWAYNNMERQLNFGRLAIHRTTVVSKSIMQNFYCKEVSYSYFMGCSRGGGQAMIEAQFYPEDYDGIVAGAPAFGWPAIAAKFVTITQKNYPVNGSKSPVLTAESLKLLDDYVMKQCDNLDGLTDKVITDPRGCKIDVSKLPLCPGNKAGANCFTKEQLAVIKSVYDPVVVDQKTVYPGFPVGLEGEPGNWEVWIAGTHPYAQPSLHHMFGTNVFKYFVFNDPAWDYSRYDFKNYFKETSFAASFLDATQTDYSEFKKRKGKMIMYHGWNDAALSAYATIDHYEAALKQDKELNSYIRLFMLPGVLHCGGGTGCDSVDWLSLIRDWVENNKAPDRIISSRFADGKQIATRPVYPYPKVAVYSGSGDAKQEKSYKVKE